jgi:hypothetical protein
MQWDATLPNEFVDQLWNDPDSLLTQNTLQDKLRCTVARVDESFGVFSWKRHSWGGAWRTVRRCLSRSTARKSWLDGTLLYASGIPTPQPRLFLERRLGPFKSRSYLLTDYVPGTSLYRYLRFRNPSAEEINDFAQQTAAIWQQLADVHIQHNDFQTENLLVDPHGKLWLIDLERLCRNQPSERARRKQTSDLDRLLHPRNWRAKPEAAATFRQAILETPAGKTCLAGAPNDNHPLKRTLAANNCESQLVTVLIPCHNAAATIVQCLRSVHDMADEILVADSGSTDETLQLVQQFGGCRIIEWTNQSDAEFESWAASQATHSWIFRIDPHEQLSAELAREVQYVLATEPSEDAFEVLHSTCFRGRWLQYGGFASKPSVRLYRKDVESNRRVGRIPYSITNELCPSVHKHMTMLLSDAAADASQDSTTVFRATPGSALLTGTRCLLNSLVMKSAWLDGWTGIHASCFAAASTYLREIMRSELQNAVAHPNANSSKASQDLDDLCVEDAATLPLSATPPTGHSVECRNRRAA